MTTETPSKEVSCDGGGGALGHPLIYLDMGEKNEIICPYCSRRFVYRPQAQAEA